MEKVLRDLVRRQKGGKPKLKPLLEFLQERQGRAGQGKQCKICYFQ